MPDRQFDTARINRLLRPLRSCATSLAALLARSQPGDASGAYTTVSRTYSKRGRMGILPKGNAFDSMAPLAVLPNPRTIRHGSYFEKAEISQLIELSQRLYAMQACFKNVLAAAFSHDHNMTCSNVPDLANMCAILLGESINTHVGAELDMAEEELSCQVDNIYDAVPMHYRWRVVVSHALDIILRVTPHQPTLLVLLLDVCIDRPVSLECHRILEAILISAISPSPCDPSGSPRVCHPAHGDFFVRLFYLWRQSPRNSGIAFTASLSRVLSGCGYAEVWTSKAISRLVNLDAFKTEDSSGRMFMFMITALGACLQNLVAKKGPPVLSDALMADALRRLLSHWLIAFLSLVPTIDSEQSKAAWAETSSDLLSWFYSNKIHTQDCNGGDLSGPIACLALHILATFAMPSKESTTIIDVLRETEPRPTVFNPLIGCTALENSACTSTLVRDCSVLFRRYATNLRCAGLLRLEASLWACILSYVDTILSRCSDVAEDGKLALLAYHSDLIEAVEEAEKRCFGVSRDDDHLEGRGTPRLSDRQACPTGGEAWDWEDSMGCWFRRAASPQTPMSEVPTLAAHFWSRNRSLISEATAAPCSEKLHHPLSETEGTPQRSISVAVALQKELCSSSNSSFFEQTQSRHSLSFSSLLSDASSNRIVLHSGGNRAGDSIPLHMREAFEYSDEDKEKQECTSLASGRFRNGTAALSLVQTEHTSSDDVLDLFAYD